MTLLIGKRVNKDAFRWLKENKYDASNVTMEDLLYYFDCKDEVEYYNILSESVTYGWLQGVSWVVHEAVEISEVKKKFGLLVRSKETYSYAHPIAEKWTILYLSSLQKEVKKK